jgi:hypothetical protein
MVGILLVVVVGFGFFYVTGGHMGGGGTPTAKLDVSVKH